MKAMILAAGRGNRLRPLTDKRPKPLVRVGNDTLIEHHIKKIAAAGFESIVINTAHLGSMIHDRIGNGSKYNIPIEYSDEGEQALETGGAISYALPLLGEQPFLVVSADIYCDAIFDNQLTLNSADMHLIMVNNPAHHPKGDFSEKELNISNQDNRLTYSGIAYLHPKLFTHEKRIYPLVDNIRECIKANTVSASIHDGVWYDIGTASRLHEANKALLNL